MFLGNRQIWSTSASATADVLALAALAEPGASPSYDSNRRGPDAAGASHQATPTRSYELLCWTVLPAFETAPVLLTFAS